MMKQLNLLSGIVLSALLVAGCGTLHDDRAQLKEEIKWQILDELRAQERDKLLSQEAKLAIKQTSAAKERAQLKKEIKEEILYELRLEGMSTTGKKIVTGEERSRLKKEIERQILYKLGEIDQASAQTGGNAEGKILWNGQGLERCQIKLVQVKRAWTLNRMFGMYREGASSFTTITDKDGNYFFENIPSGNYKIKWKLAGETSWIRRIRMKPDVSIKKGETSILNPIEANRSLVPQ